MSLSIGPLTQAEGMMMPASVKLICPRGAQALVLRKTDGRWDLPGGKLEHGEDIQAALARETSEELGLRLPEIERVGQWIYARPGRTPRLVTFFRLAEDAGFDLSDIRLSEEHSHAAWMELDAIGRLDMPPGFQDAISNVLTGRC